MDEIEETARLLEKLVRDPLADAVRGTVRITSVSEPRGRWPYQDCRLEVVAEAPGIAARTIPVEAAVSRKHWPRVGQVLPARVSPTSELLDIDWDALAR